MVYFSSRSSTDKVHTQHDFGEFFSDLASKKASALKNLNPTPDVGLLSHWVCQLEYIERRYDGMDMYLLYEKSIEWLCGQYDSPSGSTRSHA
jgi:hypothetical protein